MKTNSIVRVVGAHRGEKWVLVSVTGTEVLLGRLGDSSDTLTTSMDRVRAVRYRSSRKAAR